MAKEAEVEAKRHPPHISDQQLVGRKRTILGDLFDPRRDAAHLIKAEEYKEKLRAMMEVGDGKIPRVQSSLTPFLRGSGGSGCPFGKKRGLSENEIHFSISNSSHIGLVAVTLSTPIGCDVEQFKKRKYGKHCSHFFDSHASILIKR